MKVKEELLQQGVKVLKVVYPLLVLYFIYVVILLLASLSVVPMLLKQF